MDLKGQDVVVALKLLANPRPWTYASLGNELSLSPSQVFRSVTRAEAAGLVAAPSRKRPSFLNERIFLANHSNLKEFLVHGAKYAFPVRRGGLLRGVPTAHAAPPLERQFTGSSDPPPVWPFSEGATRGTEFSPLYKNAPQAALRDHKLYELLALVDAIRDGRARERNLAIRELTSRIDSL